VKGYIELKTLVNMYNSDMIKYDQTSYEELPNGILYIYTIC